MIKSFWGSLILVIFICSCVGTIEDKNPQVTKSAATNSAIVSFSGITKVIPVSHDKVEVYFNPAPGSQINYTYQIYVNNSDNPIKVKGNNVEVNQGGEMVYTVSGLTVNTMYSFAVGVVDGTTGEESNNNRVLYATTFANYTADFSGITAVTLKAGEAGKNTVVVQWIPATILGTLFNPRANDPVAYEIRYLAATSGYPNDLITNTNAAIERFQLPASLPPVPLLSSEREREVSGLVPGTRYYFMVRCIHKAYVDFGSDVAYLSEKNNRILSITTLNDTESLFDWNIDSISLDIPEGENGLTKIDARWTAATGTFANYRLYYLKVGDPNENPIDVEANAPDLDALKIDELNGLSEYESIDASDTYNRVINLTSYAYYKLTVVACKTFVCGDGARLIGSSKFFRVIPRVAPYSGLLRINNPASFTSLNELTVDFEAPVISAGYITQLKLYCLENQTDNDPVELVYNVASPSPKLNCNGLIRLTENPVTFAGYGSFTSMVIQGNFFPVGQTTSDKTYCLGALPFVGSADYQSNLDFSSMIIKCKTPQIKVPSALEFQGATNGCMTGANYIDVNWILPTGGIFTHFSVFWKVDNGTPFKLTDAIAGNASYTVIDGLAPTVTTYRINNLIPGTKIQYGVLAYIDGVPKLYSELNAGVQSCLIPLPTPKFLEWVDVLAVGPKADGRLGRANVVGTKSYLLETLNSYGQPIEVDVTDLTAENYLPKADFINQFGDILGSSLFNGVYGSYNNNPASTEKHQYSNSGIIKFTWKDVEFDGGTATLNDFINLYETPTTKQNRKYGYKVYRSDDGLVSWVELTNSDHAFQTITNSGLVQPSDYSERPRPNEPINTFKAITFTDYSVKFAGTDGLKNRARVYYYKVVPVFNRIGLKYEGEDENPQHIIKIVLPPENMAFIHRIIANRQVCQELGKTYSTDMSEFYTCDWNGVGSRSLGVPWVAGETIYDFGADLLMDRFELGCNYTRGDYSNADSYFTSAGFDFKGTSDGGGLFKGCLIRAESSSSQIQSGANHPAVGSSYANPYQYRVGDCLGTSMARISPNTIACADPSRARLNTYLIPGLSNADGLDDCTSVDHLAINYFNIYAGLEANKYSQHVAQSEHAAVFYNRADLIAHEWTNGAPFYRASGGDGINNLNLTASQGGFPSSCMINLPVQDSTSTPEGDGRLKPRWIPIDQLDKLVYDRSGASQASFNILTSTLGQVHSLSQFFDGTKNALPPLSYRTSYNGRYDDNTPLARIFSSNDAKLPALDSISHEQANRICQTYELSVGIYDQDTDNFVPTEDNLRKRLMRRTEGLVANAFPKEFDDVKINNIESGTNLENPKTAGIVFNGSCNSFERAIEDGQLDFDTRSGELMGTRLPSSYNGSAVSPARPEFITSSGFYDPNSQNMNTQVCTSRYGVHDLVGNSEEYSSEKLFCDFSGETFYLGQENMVSNSILYNNSNMYDGNIYKAWVLSDPNTGKCSMVEEGSARTGMFSSDGIMNIIFNVFGNVNTNMILAQNLFDQNNVSYLRNGDGYFMDFGQNRLGSPISINDTLALTFDSVVVSRSKGGADPRRGKYFSPIFGMPLECDGLACNTTTDNKSITTTEFRTLTGEAASSFVIASYPTGNGQIISDGMSEITEYVEGRSPDTYDYQYNYITSIYPLGDGTGANSYYTYYSEVNGGFLKSSQIADGTVAKDAHWRVQRQQPLAIRNFGGSRFNGTGRYAANIQGLSEYYQRYKEVGTRCAVRLNEQRP